MMQLAGGTSAGLLGLRQAAVRCGALMLLLVCFLVAGCSSAPVYPEPSPESGQILVQLSGQPREGVTGPKTREEQDEYERVRVSIEDGAQFERVDYDSIPDVVVIVKGSAPATGPAAPSGDNFEVKRDSLSREHLLMQPGGKLSVKNTRDMALTFVGVSLDDIFELKVGPNASAAVAVPSAGDYEIYCDEDESLFAFMFVTGDAAWIGNSEDDAFFDSFAPGEYAVSVHAPRLPCWYKKVKVAKGQRTSVEAALTVNALPGYGK